MKSLLLIVCILSSINAYALNLSNQQIADLYSSGKVEEKEFSKAPLTETQRSALLNKMEKAAYSLARIWPDTVLEGPYTQLADAKLDTTSVLAIYYKKELIGFSGHVRAEAAFNEECSQEEEDLFLKCLEDYKGVLFEKFIVNKAGDHIEQYAEPADFDN